MLFKVLNNQCRNFNLYGAYKIYQLIKILYYNQRPIFKTSRKYVLTLPPTLFSLSIVYCKQKNDKLEDKFATYIHKLDNLFDREKFLDLYIAVQDQKDSFQQQTITPQQQHSTTQSLSRIKAEQNNYNSAHQADMLWRKARAIWALVKHQDRLERRIEKYWDHIMLNVTAVRPSIEKGTSGGVPMVTTTLDSTFLTSDLTSSAYKNSNSETLGKRQLTHLCDCIETYIKNLQNIYDYIPLSDGENTESSIKPKTDDSGRKNKCNIYIDIHKQLQNQLTSLKQNALDTHKSKDLKPNAIIESKSNELHKVLYTLHNQWKNATSVSDSWSKSLRSILLQQGYSCAKQAVELDPNNFASHKWFSLLMDSTVREKSIREQINLSFVIRHHFEEALKLNPKDTTVLHCLGCWHFELGRLSWTARKLAQVLTGHIYDSTLQDALNYLLKAEQMDPFFYSRNLYMIALTYKTKGDTQQAKQYCQILLEKFKAKTDEDFEIFEDTKALLKDMEN